MRTPRLNRIAGGLLIVTALFMVGMGIERIGYWLAGPIGPQVGAGEMFGTFIGLVIVAVGIVVGLAARGVWHDDRRAWIVAAFWAATLMTLAFLALSTPGPPPVPVAVSIGAGIASLALVIVIVAHFVGRWTR